MFGIIGGGKIVNLMADEIGIDRSILKTALTEEGINFGLYKPLFRAANEACADEQRAIAHLAHHSINDAYKGFNKLATKFPNQPEISEGLAALTAYARLHGLIDEPALENKQPIGIDTVTNLMFLQLPFCGLDPITLSERLTLDQFALGYVFGMADMGNHQFNPNYSDQPSAITFMKGVFVETLGGNGEEHLMQSLKLQGTAEFTTGRDQGADELGLWVKSKGQRSPMGLANHFGS